MSTFPIIPSRPVAAPGRSLFGRGGSALARVALAGPGAALTTLGVVAALAAVLPPGPGGVDAIAVPLVALPLVWAAAFFHACLDPSPRRAAWVALALWGLCGAAVALDRVPPPATVVR